MTTINEHLSHPASNYLGGRFVSIEGEALRSHDPSQPDSIIWRGSPNVAHVDQAIRAAREALPAWSAKSIEERKDILLRWKDVTAKHADRIASLITDEMGKILAESKFEANALGGKVDITFDENSFRRVSEYEVAVSATRAGYCRFKPHGVMSVIGPFNFPAHLPNGHFVPALLMGNTIVFKPSEKTPATGQLMAELMHEAGLPPGVFNMVQGGADVSKALVAHEGIDGILFTGSWPVGRKILEANLDRPGRIIALEMGGNNPAVVMPSCDLRQAVLECLRAGYATSGQRCTCTRRLILHRDIADRFITAFAKGASTIVVGPGKAKEPVFMGPVISEDAANAVIKFQESLAKRGGKVVLEAARLDRPGHFVSPGLVEVDSFSLEFDQEVFGPMVQFTIVDSLDEAIAQANATRYGLAASIFTNDDDDYKQFFRGCRAGCINRNTGTAGASSKLPFGGLGHSGNHRPAAAFAVDYCAYPVANMVEKSSDAAVPAGLMFDDNWLR